MIDNLVKKRKNGVILLGFFMFFFLVFSVSAQNTAPEIVETNLTSSDATINNTLQNLTWQFVNVSDLEGDSVYNTTCNIFENGISLLLSVFSFNVNASDCSGLGNHGTIFNGNISFSGVFGRGLELNGTGKVNTTTTLDLDLVTIEFWMKPGKDYNNFSGQGINTISYQGENDYEVFLENGSLVFSYKGTNVSSTTVNWTNGQLYYVVVSFDGDMQRVYVNGVRESETKIKAFEISNSSDSVLASFGNNGEFVLKGTCQQETTCNPTANSFIVENSTDVLMYVNETGGMCTIQSCTNFGRDCNNPDDGSFIVENLHGDNVDYVNVDGRLCFSGGLIENGSP